MATWLGDHWVRLAELSVWIALYGAFVAILALGETNSIGMFSQATGTSLWLPLILGGAINILIIYLHIFRALPLLLTPGRRFQYPVALLALLIAYLIAHLAYQLTIGATLEPKLRSITILAWTIENLIAAPVIFILPAFYKFARDWISHAREHHTMTQFTVELEGELRLIRDELRTLQNGSPSNGFLRFESNREKFQTPIAAIKFIKAAGNYIEIVTGARTYTVYGSVKDIADRLPRDQFIRIHRSYLVNLKQVSRIKGQKLFVNDVELPIGESFKKQLLKQWHCET